MNSLILWIVLATAANTTLWQRHVQSGKSDSFDVPKPHSMAYFIQDPFVRDVGNDFCSDCTPRGKASVHLHHKFTTQVHRVAILQGFAIYDVFYQFDNHIGTNELDWKCILVEVSPGQFREIYHLQPTAAQAKPSFVLKVASQDILATREVIPGTGNNYYEDYYYFSPAGPKRIDIEEITRALHALLPTGFGVWKGGGLDLSALRYHMPVWKEGDPNCCPTGGAVDIQFRLEGSQIIVTHQQFDPSATYNSQK